MHARRLARWSGTGMFCVLALVVLSACTSDGSNPSPIDESQSSSTPGAATEPLSLKVLEYNVEYGGDSSTDKVIGSVDADVVGVLESYNRLPEMARAAGYPYYDVGLQLLSKYPILEPSGADGLYALIEVKPGFVVAYVNTHLDYVAYGPRLLANGMSVHDVIASENQVRTSTMHVLMPSMKKLLAAGYPLFLTGDFNEPSSLDYGATTVGTRPGVTQPVPWPVSKAVLGLGLHDSFRQVHPNPVADPGNTWGDVNKPSAEGNRIDFVYSGGPVEVQDSKVVGETGGPNVDIGFDRWTSDHRAVVSTFDVTPVPMPTTLSLDKRMLTQGDDLTVYYNAPGRNVSRVEITGAGTTPAGTTAVEGESGTLTMTTDHLAPDGYQIALLDDAGAVIARNQFWVRSPDATVHLRTAKSSYAVGQPITVFWNDGPANRWDWVAVYRAGAANPHQDDYLLWGYTGGHDSGALPPSVSGSMIFDASSQGKPWPLPPGDYVVQYLLTDQYNSAGRAPFTVRK